MSVKVMAAVFERYPNGGGEMLLALALADHAHDDGTHIWPSIKQLAEKTRQSERSIQYQLRKMEESGWLILVNSGNGGRSQHREYAINPAWIKGAEIAPFTKGANDDKKGATGDAKGAIDDKKGCNGLHPHITIIEPSVTVIEPSATPKAPGVPPIAEEVVEDPVMFRFPLNDKTEYELTQSQIDQFADLYPAIDVMAHVRACLGWNIANPTRRKTRRGILSHINTWLADKQNKAPPQTRASPGYQTREDKTKAFADALTGNRNDQRYPADKIIDLN